VDERVHIKLRIIDKEHFIDEERRNNGKRAKEKCFNKKTPRLPVLRDEFNPDKYGKNSKNDASDEWKPSRHKLLGPVHT
jgi:hypothetical protein